MNYGSLARGTGTYGVVNVNQGGIYAPGNSPGIVTAAAVHFDNSPFNSGAPALQIELAGTTPGIQYDQLHVTGQLSLGGALQVQLVGGFAPVAGNSFDILDWGSLSGTFSSLQLPNLNNGPLGWDTSQLYTTGVLSVTAALRGDFNRDGHVDAADILPAMKALTDPLGYETQYGVSFANLQLIGDVNGDKNFNNADLQDLLSILKSGGGSADSVPEPASWVLVLLAVAIVSGTRFYLRCVR